MGNGNISRKLQSRKFWIAVALMLAAFAQGISGFADPNVCLVMMVVAGGIYKICEAWVDGKDRAASQSNVTTVFVPPTSF